MADLSLRQVCALFVFSAPHPAAWGDSRVANVGGATLGMHLFESDPGRVVCHGELASFEAITK